MNSFLTCAIANKAASPSRVLRMCLFSRIVVNEKKYHKMRKKRGRGLIKSASAVLLLLIVFSSAAQFWKQFGECLQF